MATVRRGDRGSEVVQLQHRLNQAGYSCGAADGVFGAVTERAVRAFQAAAGLAADGVVGPRTQDALYACLKALIEHEPEGLIDSFAEVEALPARFPQTALDHRISNAVRLQQICDGGQGCRYGGWIDPYYFDSPEFDARQQFEIPCVGRIVPGAPVTQPAHGGTCSPWAGLMLGWLLCANQDYNFRIGRSAYDIANQDHDHVLHNSKIPGYAEYCEVEGVRRLEKIPLSSLYRLWTWLHRVNFVEMDHHCILVLKVGGPDGLNLVDPLVPGRPLPSGLYRWAADGFYPQKDVDGDGVSEKYYSGTRQTFRRIAAAEGVTQGWDVYRVADVDLDTCSPVIGPWTGRQPWPLVLQSGT